MMRDTVLLALIAVKQIYAGGEWLWTVQHGSSDSDAAYAMVLAAGGDVLIAGDTLGNLGSIEETGPRHFDGFVMKFGAAGQWLWTTQHGSEQFVGVRPQAMVMATWNEVMIAGHTDGKAASYLEHLGGEDIFIARVSASGQVLWMRQRGSDQDDYASSVALDSSGNILVTGSTAGSLDGNSNSGMRDIFIMKFAASADWSWTKQVGSSAMDGASKIVVNTLDEIFISGETFGSMGDNLNAGGADAVVMKLSAAGDLIWLTQFGSGDADSAAAMVLDPTGNAFVAGYREGRLQNHGSPADADGFSSDIFLMQLAGETGEILWQRQHGSSERDFPSDMALNAEGNILLAGETYGDLDGHTNEGPGRSDVFVMKFSQVGERLWTVQRGSAAGEKVAAIASSPAGEIFVAGSTSGSLEGCCANCGGFDIFLMKFNDNLGPAALAAANQSRPLHSRCVAPLTTTLRSMQDPEATSTFRSFDPVSNKAPHRRVIVAFPLLAMLLRLVV
mmetsp:Transcript_53858/g.128272  ORF Transcript_53858/g.128272 Transcript_53858/m.128272 type:complete len:502 (-) Transcript_53858:70-1575(-)